MRTRTTAGALPPLDVIACQLLLQHARNALLFGGGERLLLKKTAQVHTKVARKPVAAWLGASRDETHHAKNRVRLCGVGISVVAVAGAACGRILRIHFLKNRVFSLYFFAKKMHRQTEVNCSANVAATTRRRRPPLAGAARRAQDWPAPACASQQRSSCALVARARATVALLATSWRRRRCSSCDSAARRRVASSHEATS